VEERDVERTQHVEICKSGGMSRPRRDPNLMADRARAAHAPYRREWAFPRRGERRWVDKKCHVALAVWLTGFISS